MSTSSEIVNSAKPNFSQTCNLLSRYLKQKGSLGDLTLGISNGKSENLTTMNLFPVVEKPMNSQIETKQQPERSQMTIFYNGQVIVFNDFPADKANDLMQLAIKNNSPNLVAPKLAPAKFVQRPPQPNIPELQLPIARNASLHRFLEKRKDRIAAKAPYQLNKSKNENNSSWLGLAAAQSSLQFGLQ